MISNFKRYIFNFKILGKPIFRGTIIKREGGEQISPTLREVTEKYYKVSVGQYSYGCCFNPSFNLGGTVIIGRYCSFATDAHYFGANHPIGHASMSPYFYNPAFGQNVEDVKRETLTIGNDVWCGYGTIITNKCHKIGNGAVIAAGSIVTSNVPPYAVVMGSPARITRFRFDEETITLLEDSKWFELSPEEIMKYYDYIKEPKLFAKAIIDDRQKKSKVSGDQC